VQQEQNKEPGTYGASAFCASYSSKLAEILASKFVPSSLHNSAS